MKTTPVLPRRRLRQRRLFLERLESRRMLACLGQNAVNPLDVSGDGNVSPLDALLNISKINRDGAGPCDGAGEIDAFYDVNDNGTIDPFDVLPIINHLNGGPAIIRMSVQAPTSAVRGEPVTVNFVTDATGPATFQVDWDGNGTIDETVEGSALSTSVEHVFPFEGRQTTRVRVIGSNQAFEGTARSQTEVHAIRQTNGDLHVGGTAASDVLFFSTTVDGQLEVHLNGATLGSFAVPNRVLVYGQSGNDQISGPESVSSLLLGGPGDDTLQGGQFGDELSGGPGHDLLIGGEGSDLLMGEAGDDELLGGGGSDTVRGGPDRDLLRGGDGIDLLLGEGGDDQLEGGPGDDVLQGGFGIDLLMGGDGNDLLQGSFGDDELDGQAGHDLLLGDDGADGLFGRGGRDILIGGAGRDLLAGGPEQDVVIGGTTVLDLDQAALRRLLLQWTADSPFATRVAAIRAGSQQLSPLGVSSVLDDGEPDDLRGEEDLDWFFGTRLDSTDLGEDEVFTSTSLDGINVPITTDPGVQQMPSIAVNPLDDNHVVVAFMDYSLVDTGYAGIGVATSRNGGQSWEQVQLPVQQPFAQGAAHPVAKFDHQGRLYVTYMAATFLGDQPGLTNPVYGPLRVQGSQANNGIFVVRSDDGGSTWSTPVAITSHLFDGFSEVPFNVNPDFAIDTYPTLPDGGENPSFGNLYVIWTRVYPPGQFPSSPNAPAGTEIRFATSRDGGMTWETQDAAAKSKIKVDVIVDTIVFDPGLGTSPGEGFVDFSRLAVGPDQSVFVSMFAGGNFGFNVSRDGGETFQVSSFETADQIVFGTSFNSQVDRLGLPNQQFRTTEKRSIAVDPSRAGTVLATEAISVSDAIGNPIDPAEIYFGRSTDFARSWDTRFTVGSHPDVSDLVCEAGTGIECLDANRAVTLNDDNEARSATEVSTEEVISGQAFPQIATTPDGHIGVIWYDSRRDPNNNLLDVFGAVSFDGGETFTPNFRITDMSFDAKQGSFTNAIGEEEFFLGDLISLSMSQDTAYSAWTDTRNGNQDIFVARFSSDPPPPALNDRLEPNDDPDRSLTRLGPVVQTTLPKLKIVPGDEDWFAVTASATGTISVELRFDDPAAVPADTVQLDIRAATGTAFLTSSEPLLEGSQVVGRRVLTSAEAGDQFQIRVRGVAEAAYSLHLESLTEDLGTRAQAIASGTLGEGGKALYLVSAAAAGSADFALSVTDQSVGTVSFQVIGAESQDVLGAVEEVTAGATERLSLQVQQREGFAILVDSATSSTVDFTFEFTNWDLFSTPSVETLFFPVAGGPSQADVADVNNDGHLDVAVTSTVSNTLSILLGGADGLLQAPRQFPLGAYSRIPTDVTGLLPTFGRDVAIADFNQDDVPDFVATNAGSADISLLLGRGDGTPEPQRRFDATPAPFDLDVGDLNSDGLLDVVVIETVLESQATISGMINRGNGTFGVQRTSTISVAGNNGTVRLGDFDEDGTLDVVASGDGGPDELSVMLGNGDGTFTFLTKLHSARRAVALTVADINGDDHLDIATAGFGGDSNLISVVFGNGDGTFQPELRFANQISATGLEVIDFGSQVILPDGSIALGPPDGRPDLVVADSGAAFVGLSKPRILIRPGLYDDEGQFVGLGEPQVLATAVAPQDLDIADLNNDQSLDIVVVDRGGLLVVFGDSPTLVPNTSPETAREIGTVVHLVDQTQTIVPGRQEAFYNLTIPKEAIPGAVDEIVDFSGNFEFLEGPGLEMELLDESGRQLASGERFRIRASQGEELTLRVFSRQESDGTIGYGAFTPIINVLPQATSIEAQALLPGRDGNPGGPTTSIVVTLQGDRLDPDSAERSENYQVVHAGADGELGTGDDTSQPIHRVVYSPSTNVDISSGLTFPTAVQQTVTLLFEQPLPAGTYRVDLASEIQTEAFNAEEAQLLTDSQSISGHPIVSIRGDQIVAGSTIEAVDLVMASGDLGDVGVFQQGTSFLSQMHADLSAILDSELSRVGDDPSVTASLIDHVLTRLAPSLGERGEREVAVMALWLDPVSIDLETETMDKIEYDKDDGEVVSSVDECYAEVGGNIEIVLCVVEDPDTATFDLEVSDVPDTARGGVILLTLEDEITVSLTEDLRDGVVQFPIIF